MHIRDKALVPLLVENADNPWWRETTLLYTALVDADEVVRGCLARGTVPALIRAYDCLEDGADLDATLRADLWAMLDSAQDGSLSRDQLRLVAGVLLSRYLRDAVTLPSGARLCRSPVPASLYRLFELTTAGVTRTAHSAGPVIGVDDQQAARFSRWAENTLGESIRFPSMHELARPEAECVADKDVWTTTGLRNGHPGEHPHWVTQSALTPILETDLVRLIPLIAAVDVWSALVYLSKSPDDTAQHARLFRASKWGVFHRTPMPKSRLTAHEAWIWADRWRGKIRVMLHRFPPVVFLDARGPVGILSTYVGKALADAYEKATAHADKRSFTDSLLNCLPFTQGERVMNPGSVLPRWNRAESLLAEWPGMPPWAQHASRELRRASVVLQSPGKLHREAVSTIRVMAVCLAGERGLVEQRTAASLEEVIYGATMLHERAESRRRRSEVIVLVQDAKKSLFARPPR
ncbi:hypothetical protein ACOBQX_12435 [Actinokineospora sp. G85]|uniref:hypothetical protein n=1 Tax=Actinokineospora sp. G85 TaxID=3406626 RepID=UPI003C76CFCF